MIELNLPWPPTVNTYWRSLVIAGRIRVVLSEKGRQFKERVKNLFIGKRVPRFGDFDRIRMTVQLFPPDRKKVDLDNRLKAILDALQDAGVYADDSQIDELSVVKGKVVKFGKCIVTLEQIDATP